MRHGNERTGNVTGKGGHGPNLTPEKIAEIRLRLSRFETPKSIAADLGISTATVNRHGGAP